LWDEILEIADDSSHDYVEKIGVDGKVTRVFNSEHIEDCRRRIQGAEMDVGPLGAEEVPLPLTHSIRSNHT